MRFVLIRAWFDLAAVMALSCGTLPVARAEDRATLGSDLSADTGVDWRGRADRPAFLLRSILKALNPKRPPGERPAA